MKNMFGYLTDEDIVSAPYYYHVTPSYLISRIQEIGLDPNARDEKEKSPRLFLYSNPLFISAAIQLKCPMGIEQVTILRISSEHLVGKKMSLDNGDEWTIGLARRNDSHRAVMADGGSIICYDPIPPELIETRGTFDGKNKNELIRRQIDISILF